MVRIRRISSKDPKETWSGSEGDSKDPAVTKEEPDGDMVRVLRRYRKNLAGDMFKVRRRHSKDSMEIW
jgi:hypothetical protein